MEGYLGRIPGMSCQIGSRAPQMQGAREAFDTAEEVVAEYALGKLRAVLDDLTDLGGYRSGRLATFHVKRDWRQAQSAVARARPALIWTARIETAAGVIPGIRAA